MSSPEGIQPHVDPASAGKALLGKRVRSLLGLQVHALTMKEALDLCAQTIRSGSSLQVGVVNAAKLVNMRSDPHLRDAIASADVVLADGASVVWASRLLGAPLPERVAGIDLFESLLERAHEEQYSVYLLGATEDVLQRVKAKIEADYPGVRIVGARNGYFQEEESEAVAGAIGRAQPDLLFVAITSPKKEIFLARYRHLLRARVCHGVGGSFDVLAGKTRRAPKLWQRLGLEWLYRVVQEPRRLWKRYLVTNTIFVAMVLAELYRTRIRGPRRGEPG